jgi:hypothetical protein
MSYSLTPEHSFIVLSSAFPPFSISVYPCSSVVPFSVPLSLCGNPGLPA